ncbi:MAG: FtsX-like permease family protein [Candidatus Aminicenantes bacterium]|nr:FtsX-like permease family protein [Candidatus Aminicenantes bacterium]NIM82108.1 FtsX-like permease family protein [Candidatus Aminicenantes bacterium]NIN21503.1 FtsX-like permease family protein [Candidatus Aminicenantes bacterium]NIN45314.1 FtsX-like permease family protein [Candidatus Aminicenantes bacterium]NIN88131.1 FtsX-like permease family protein [Candidatus Aminicenantes bacterium]
MWFYIKLAWRNIFRNKRRTIIASIAIGIGLASLIMMDAMMKGMYSNMIKSATASFMGEAQIHGSDFRETSEVEKTVNKPEQVVEDLKTESLVDKFTLRTLSMGMISSPANVSAILLVGIDPVTEQGLSKIDEAVENGKGSYFEGDKPRDIVIGSKLAEVLEIGLGDRVVVTVAQAHTGDLNQELFRVSGIYHFDIKEMDTGMAFIRLPIAQQMLGIPNQVHQVAIKFKDIRTSLLTDIPFWDSYSRYENEAVSWGTILPQLKAVSQMTLISVIVLVIILGGVVMFGIINALFMSLYERMFEFAVLRAVGTRSGGVRKLIIFEAGAMAIISIIIGVILGFIATLILTYTGIDYRGIEFAGTTIHEIIYPEMTVWQFILYPIGVIIFTMFVGLYPAWVGGRMHIANALRKSL